MNPTNVAGKVPPVAQPWRLRQINRLMMAKLVVVALVMVGFGYAMVPMYRHICSALGINVLSLGEQQVTSLGSNAGNTQVNLARSITVEFDANAHGPWDFKPDQRHVRVHPGEVTTVWYEFRNRQNHVMTAQAVPSYAPKQATAHFNKLECFCFQEHTLAPGQSKRWPVVFVIDDKLPRNVDTITLSYTFFEVGGKTPVAPGAGT